MVPITSYPTHTFLTPRSTHLLQYKDVRKMSEQLIPETPTPHQTGRLLIISNDSCRWSQWNNSAISINSRDMYILTDKLQIWVT